MRWPPLIIWLVSKRMKPDIINMMAELIAKLSVDMPRKILAMAAPKTTIMPVIRKPARKEKSFLVVITYAERLKNIKPVPPSACMTI